MTLRSVLVGGGIAVALTALILWATLNTAELRARPEADRARARKAARLGVWAAVATLGVAAVLTATPGASLSKAPLILYLGLWGFVVWLVARSYRLGVRRDVGLARASFRSSPPDPERLLTRMAWLNLSLALGIGGLLVCIPVFGIDFANWATLLTLIVSPAAVIRARWEPARSPH